MKKMPLPLMVQNQGMRLMFGIIGLITLVACSDNNLTGQSVAQEEKLLSQSIHPVAVTDTTSWAYFLQHLPFADGPVLDYAGHPTPDQAKKFAIVKYDVGHRDLQQCADALMRLRAEYLFAGHRTGEIAFHFVSGPLYRFSDYCKGVRPVPAGNSVSFKTVAPVDASHRNLRNYLDIVYTYASTISLAKELKPANGLGIGSIIIHPGSPGHCFIIADEATGTAGQQLYKLVEGYTPAQTIYVLRNTNSPSLGCWYPLKQGAPVYTASYSFTSYQTKAFE